MTAFSWEGSPVGRSALNECWRRCAVVAVVVGCVLSLPFGSKASAYNPIVLAGHEMYLAAPSETATVRILQITAANKIGLRMLKPQKVELCNPCLPGEEYSLPPIPAEEKVVFQAIVNDEYGRDIRSDSATRARLSYNLDQTDYVEIGLEDSDSDLDFDEPLFQFLPNQEIQIPSPKYRVSLKEASTYLDGDGNLRVAVSGSARDSTLGGPLKVTVFEEFRVVSPLGEVETVGLGQTDQAAAFDGDFPAWSYNDGGGFLRKVCVQASRDVSQTPSETKCKNLSGERPDLRTFVDETNDEGLVTLTLFLLGGTTFDPGCTRAIPGTVFSAEDRELLQADLLVLAGLQGRKEFKQTLPPLKEGSYTSQSLAKWFAKQAESRTVGVIPWTLWTKAIEAISGKSALNQVFERCEGEK